MLNHKGISFSREALRLLKLRGTHVRAAGSGRPSATTTREDRAIVAAGRQDPFVTEKQIVKNLGASVCCIMLCRSWCGQRKAEQGNGWCCICSTAALHLLPTGLSVSRELVGQRLRHAGLRCGRVARKPALTPLQIKKRLRWAREHAHWTVDEWRHVIFSDEKNFHRQGKQKHVVRRPPGCRYDPRFVSGVLPFRGGPSISYWGAWSLSGTKYLKRFRGTMRSTEYREVVSRMLKHAPTVRATRGRKQILLQDGASAHTAKKTLRFFETTDVPFLQLPPKSPDLNVIETVWAEMVRRLGPKLRSEEEVVSDVRAVWDALPRAFFRRLVRSMPRRCEAVIAAGGGNTSY